MPFTPSLGHDPAAENGLLARQPADAPKDVWTTNRFRRARGQILGEQIKSLARHEGRNIRILDVGGRYEYWNNVDTTAIDSITIINNDETEVLRRSDQFFRYAFGDACHLTGYEDKSFDLVHANSVIEHVGGWENMSAMAKESLRVGRSGWIQTPAWSFAIEWL